MNYPDTALVYWSIITAIMVGLYIQDRKRR